MKETQLREHLKNSQPNIDYIKVTDYTTKVNNLKELKDLTYVNGSLLEYLNLEKEKVSKLETKVDTLQNELRELKDVVNTIYGGLKIRWKKLIQYLLF